MKRFEIYKVDFSGAKGSEQDGVRPAVIIQSNIGLKFSPTVWVVPLTSKLKKTNQATHYIVRADENNKLRCDSMAEGEHARAVDVSRIKNYIGTISNESDQLGVFDTYIANITGTRNNISAVNF